ARFRRAASESRNCTFEGSITESGWVVLGTVFQRDDQMQRSRPRHPAAKIARETALLRRLHNTKGLNGEVLPLLSAQPLRDYFAAAPVSMVSSITTSVRA